MGLREVRPLLLLPHPNLGVIRMAPRRRTVRILLLTEVPLTSRVSRTRTMLTGLDTKLRFVNFRIFNPDKILGTLLSLIFRHGSLVKTQTCFLTYQISTTASLSTWPRMVALRLLSLSLI